MNSERPTPVGGLAGLPVPRRDLIDRPRLLDVLAERFDRPLTVLSAGAGFGKSTLLTQAVHDPVATARGTDVFHRITPSDHEPDTLLTSLFGLIAHDVATGSSVEQLTAAIWHASPEHVSIILDDIHLIDPASESWQLIERILIDLPSNGHLVLSGRGTLGIKLAKRLATGEAVELDGAALAFTAAELDAFARLRSVDRDRLATHGWPALIELEAHSGVAGAHRFVAEEVLAEIGQERVEALRLVAVHNTIDDELVAAVSGLTCGAADLVSGLPLTYSVGDGTAFALHDLWRDLLVADLPDAKRKAALSATAQVLFGRGQLRQACQVAIEADDVGIVRRILAEFTRDIRLAHSIADRDALLAMMPATLSNSPEVLLLHADSIFATEPNRAGDELRAAIEGARDDGQGEIEVLAHVRLGELAYRSGNVDGLDGSIDSLAVLERSAVTGAAAAHALLDVWRHLLDNAAAKALDLIGGDALQGYPPIAALVDYYRAVLLGFSGHCTASLVAIDDLRRTPHGKILARMGGFASIMEWYRGTLDADDRATTLQLLTNIGTDRQVHLFVEGAATASLFLASAGDLEGARAILAEAQAHRDRIPDTSWGSITVELATAITELLGGDEPMAAARLRELLPDTGPFAGFSRHVFGNIGPTLYLLAPRSRSYFDNEDTGPDLAMGTAVGRALVALRENGNVELAARLPWSELERLRTWAFEPHLAELALAAVAGGTLQAGAAIDTLRTNPRAILRHIAQIHDGVVADLALERLASTPARPSTVLRVNVLGPIDVQQGDRSLAESAPMRRKMVRELLMLLVHRRRIRRAEVMDVLWPDKDESAGGNNLRVTLMHLRNLIEANDDSNDDVRDDDTPAPAWHLRSDGDHLVLHASDRLSIDADEFTEHIASARDADRARDPAEALRHYVAACQLYRGPYIADAADPDWASHHRVSVHLDAVEAATRAAELLATSGEAAQAIMYAGRAIEAEPLSERAHRALVRALAAHGDRAGAARAYTRVRELLGAEGLTPEDATVRLGAEL